MLISERQKRRYLDLSERKRLLFLHKLVLLIDLINCIKRTWNVDPQTLLVLSRLIPQLAINRSRVLDNQRCQWLIPDLDYLILHQFEKTTQPLLSILHLLEFALLHHFYSIRYISTIVDQKRSIFDLRNQEE